MSYLKKTLRGLSVACIVVVVSGPQSSAAGFRADTLRVVADTLTEQIEVITPSETPSVPSETLRQQLAKLEKTIPLNYNKAVHGFVDYFAFRKPSYTKKVLERMPMFFPLYERLLDQYGLPDELKYLSIVESSLDPKAVSRVGAGGLWQFMPYTGKDYGLYQDEYVDERMEPVKSTVAACRYLKQLYNVFGDWHLALAAYNSGPGTVKRAMRRSGGDSFWSIYDYLPKETRAYVPQFIALTYMMNHASDYGIVPERPEYPIPFDTIQVNSYFNLDRFCKDSGVDPADLRKMNPHIMTSVLPEYTRKFVLRVPSDQFSYFEANRASIMDSASRLPSIMTNVLLASTENVNYGLDSARKRDWFPFTNANEEQAKSRLAVAANPVVEEGEDIEAVVRQKPKKIVHVAQKGEGLTRIADKYNVEVYDLKKWNNLRSTQLQRGQKIVILREPEIPATSSLAKVSKETNRQERERATKVYSSKYHTVQPGDTLWNISQRYEGMSVDRLKKLNHIEGNSLKLGQKLIVG